MNNIIKIPTNELYAHPNNPRKDLGDLTELTASIKASGVMQNLTVIPGHYEDDLYCDDGYTVIIGHRRCAASRAAGLTELPCVVVEMTEKEQLSTMMAENMQRVDLTAYEQAKGFQLMFDLGDSVSEISRKTGVSETTVYVRKKLLRYKESDFKAAEARQISLRELTRLNAIADDERANYLLAYAGTKDFDYEVDKALKIIKEKEAKIKAVEKAKIRGGVRAERGTGELDGWLSVGTWYPNFLEKDLNVLLNKIGNAEWRYTVDGYGMSIWRERTKDDDLARSEGAARNIWRDAILREADSIRELMRSRVYAFASNYSPKSGDLATLNAAFLELKLLYEEHYVDYSSVAKRLGVNIEGYSGSMPIREAITQCYRLKPEETILKYMIYSHSWLSPLDMTYTTAVEPEIRFRKNQLAKHVYKTLEKLGFEISEEESSFWNGTHEIFKRKRISKEK